VSVKIAVTGLGPKLGQVTYSARIDFAKASLGYRLPKFVKSGETMRSIAAAVAEAYGLTVEELRGQCRERSVAHPRQEAMWRMRQVLDEDGRPRYSLPQIGNFLGHRDHTTVLHGVRAYEKRRQREEMLDLRSWADLGTWAA
jgi:chromosomal replication initiation ATPase DnaA